MSKASNYYYEQLNKEQQKAYYAMKEGLLNQQDSFAVPMLDKKELSDIYFMVRMDCPEIFYSVRFSYRYYPDSTAVEFIPEYLFQKDKIREHRQAMQARVKKLARQAQGLDEKGKELFIHDFIVQNVRYDKLKKEYSHEIIGALGNGVAVCEGMAKAVKILCDELGIWYGLPEFIEKTTEIQSWLKSKSKEELKTIWKCNDKITEQNFNRLENMDLYHLLTPAVLSYEGIAFQYMAPSVFEDSQFEYVQNHLRILSAFYGVLKPLDGVTPYRLEMQAKVGIGDAKNLYEYWGDMLYCSVIDNSRIIINLASKEYSKSIEKYLTLRDKYITIVFCELSGDKLVTKGTYAKMARGEMVRFMAENSIENPEDIKKFDRLGYAFRHDLSSDTEYIFERRIEITSY